jgi:S-adenosyl-L-methionine hydrolase (adenosine-forming)
MTRPIVFLTDYGLSDPFVGICHGVIARIAPDARVVDLMHAVPRQDVLRGGVELARAVPFMPDDAVYVAVVDPGVGSSRRAVAMAAGASLLVGPDNGVLSLAWESLGGVEAAAEIRNEKVILSPLSRTFHGRDIFAPAAAHLALGMSLEELGPSVDPATLLRLDVPSPMVAPGAVGARVTMVDSYGNVELNATAAELETAGIDGDMLSVNGRTVPRAGVFSDLDHHGLGVIVDSLGFLSLVMNHGSAAAALGLTVRDTVVLEQR